MASKRRRCCSGESDDGGYFAGTGRFKSGAISGRRFGGLESCEFQPGFQLRELLLRRLVAAPRQKLAKHFRNRVEGRVLEKCPGRRLDPGVRRASDLFMEALHHARFADPRFAYDQRHLAFAFEGTFPTIHQQAQFVFAPDKWSQSTRCRGRFEPSSYSAWLDYPVKLDRPFDPLERLRSPIFNHEQPGDQPMRIRGYQYRAGSGGRLHPRGDIGRVAEYIGCLCPHLRQPPPRLNRCRPSRRALGAWGAR